MTKNPEKYQDLVLWAWLEIVSPLRDTNSNIISCHFLSVPYPIGIAKALAVDRVRPTTLTGTKTSFLPLKDMASTPLLWGFVQS